LIELLLKLQWWNKPIEEIQALIPILTCGDLEKVKKEVRGLVETSIRSKIA
jgi:virginiamycin A acetyltransferase